MSYVVVVTLENHSLVYGSYRSRAKAAEMAAKVNAQIERCEEEAMADWRRRYDAGGSPEEIPGPLGTAYVAQVRPPRMREAVRFATTGNPE